MGRSSRGSAPTADGRPPSAVARPLSVVLLALLLLACGKREGAGSGTGTGTGTGMGRQAVTLRVAAAADLAYAFKDVGAAYEKAEGDRVDFTFGSTGLLAKQVSEGAPFDVFAAANESFADEAVRSGQCLAESKAMYAEGRLVLWTKDPSLKAEDLGDLLGQRYVKIAIANPDHAPYGRAAKDAMTRMGVWEGVKPKIVYGENIQQALTYAQTGNAEIGVVALSLAVVSGGTYVGIDPALHAPLRQALVVCRGGARGAHLDRARRFSAFVGSPAGRAIMTRYGFVLPGEALPGPR